MLNKGLFLGLLCVAGVAFGDPVWSIGKSNDSYDEFALARHHENYAAQFTNDPVYIVGKSKPEKDWPFIHPGPSDAWAGARKHVFSIQFTMRGKPKGVYRLVVRAANTHSAGGPKLAVDVNGLAERTFAFAPGADDRSLTDPAIGRRQSQSFLLPASCLKKGPNAIALTVVEGSWILYDTVYLEKTDVKGIEVGKVEAASTPLFRDDGGTLKQAVRVTVQNSGLGGEAVIGLENVAGSEQKVNLAEGPNTFDLLVAPFKEAIETKALVRVGDKTFASEAFTATPERQWKIYLAPSAHTDIGYTDLQERIFERHNTNTQAVLKACETTPDFKWNMEVFAQTEWLREKEPELYKELERRIVEGRIGLTSMYLNMLTGLCTGEELAKVIAPAQAFGRAHNVPVTVATITDVPTTIGTLPMFLKHAGVKYFVEGINEDRGPVFMHADKRMIQSPFWWEGMDGSRVIAMFTRSYGQGQVIGLRDNVDVLRQKLPGWIKAIDRPDYPGDAIYGNGAFWDNESVTPHFIDVANEWNKTWAFPKIIVARADEYFRYVEEHFADALPVFHGDMGSYWEDGAASSAKETGMNRIAKARLNEAERWCALASARSPNSEFPKAEFAKAWDDAIYYDEHTWGAAGSIAAPKSEQTVKQWEYKAAYAQRAFDEAAGLFDKNAEEAFAALSKVKSDGEYVTVRNACSWPRDILVNVPCDGSVLSLAHSSDAKLLGQDNQHILFEAKNVPAMGYRRYKLERGKAAAPETPLLRQGADEFTWETPAFRYKIDPKTGAFTSIEDLRTHREWVDAASGYGVNQFLYVKGGDGTSLIHPGAKAAPPLQPLTHTQAHVRSEGIAGGLGVLVISREGEGVPAVETECIVRDDGRIDFLNRITKEDTTEKEAGYFAFPFKLGAPDQAKTFFDLPYGIVEADREQPPGACREWYAANTFAAVSDGQSAAYLATREMPLFTAGVMNRGAWPASVENNHGTVFAYVFNNYWHTNYKASQGGTLDAAYSARFDNKDFDPAFATRFGQEWQCLHDADASGDKPGTTVAPGGAPREKEASFVKMSDGPVLLAELSQDDEGRLLARLYNPSSAASTTSIAFPALRMKHAWKTDLFGKHEEAIKVAGNAASIEVGARSIATLVFDMHGK